MRIAFCDDEPEVTGTLESCLRTYFEQNGLKQPEYVSYFSGETLLEDPGEIDMAFLDVKMGGISGIVLGEKLREKNPEMIVFMVTSFMEYLDDAMRFHVFRYLSKPIEPDRLFRNMDYAIEQYRKYERSHQKVDIKTREGIFTVPAADIVYIEAMEHRTHVYVRKAKKCSTWEPLEYWISLLDSNVFFQTHRSYLINMDYVTNILKDRVELCDGKYSVMLTAKRRKAFREAYAKMLRYI